MSTTTATGTAPITTTETGINPPPPPPPPPPAATSTSNSAPTTSSNTPIASIPPTPPPPPSLEIPGSSISPSSSPYRNTTLTGSRSPVKSASVAATTASTSAAAAAPTTRSVSSPSKISFPTLPNTSNLSASYGSRKTVTGNTNLVGSGSVISGASSTNQVSSTSSVSSSSSASHGTPHNTAAGGTVLPSTSTPMTHHPTGTVPSAYEKNEEDLPPPPSASDRIVHSSSSVLLGVQALERQQQRKQDEIEALGVLALERQQAEMEARRKRTGSIGSGSNSGLLKSLTAPASVRLMNINPDNNTSHHASRMNVQHSLYASNIAMNSSHTVIHSNTSANHNHSSDNPFHRASSSSSSNSFDVNRLGSPMVHNPFDTFISLPNPQQQQQQQQSQNSTLPFPYPYPREGTSTTAASGSEGDGSGNEWYRNQNYDTRNPVTLSRTEEDHHPNKDNSDDPNAREGKMIRTGSFHRFLKNTQQKILHRKNGNGGFPHRTDDSNGNDLDDKYLNPSSGMNSDSNVQGSFGHATSGQAPNVSDGTLNHPMSQLSDNTTGRVRSHLKPLISGYLHKRGRDGKWQRRWFESDGRSLSYSKSNKHSKVLATLDLARVGEIKMDESDPAGCSFTIKVAKRNYYLNANSRELAMDWVICLSRIRDAKMQIGGLTLIEPSSSNFKFDDQHVLRRRRSGGTPRDTSRVSGSDDENPMYRSESGDELSARVGVVSVRERTKGYGKNDLNDDLKSYFVAAPNPALAPNDVGLVTSVGGRVSPTSSPKSSLTRPTNAGNSMPVLPTVFEDFEYGRWEKRRSKLQNITRRLSRWARRMTMIRCVIKDDVVHMAHAPPTSHGNYPNHNIYNPRVHDTLSQQDYHSDAQYTRSHGQTSECEGSHSSASRTHRSFNEDYDSLPNPPSVSSADRGFTGYEKSRPRRTLISTVVEQSDDASTGQQSIQSKRLSSGRVSPNAGAIDEAQYYRDSSHVV